MKEILCEAFCNDVTVTAVPAGFAVGTAFRRDDGDRVSFYIVRGDNGLLHLEDDGDTLPSLEAAGVDFETETRARALQTLLDGVGGFFDADNAIIRTRPFPEKELAEKAIDFVAVMLRLGDFLLLTPERVASTFKEDASAKIRESIGLRASIRENQPVSPTLSEVTPDMVIEAENRSPVAVFFGNTASRVHDAIFLQMAATHEAKLGLSVVALLEDDHSVNNDLRRRASNRLATVPVYRQDEEAAVRRIQREALGVLA